MTRKTCCFEGCFWCNFNNLGLALGMTLNVNTSMTTELRVGKFRGLIAVLLISEVTWEKLLGHFFAHASWRGLKRFKVKQTQEARDLCFKMFKIMRFLRSSKCSKIIVELTFTTQKINACSLLDWLFYSVVPFLGKLGPKTQIVSLSWNLVLRLGFHSNAHFFSFWPQIPFFR